MCDKYIGSVTVVRVLFAFVGEGIDFTTVSTSVTFPAGSTSQIVNVTLNDDDILEPTEQYQVFIKSIIVTGEEPIPPVVLGDIIVANGTILDNDG